MAQALGQEANRLVSSVDMLLSAAAARVDAHTFGASQVYTRQLLSGLMAHIPAVMAVRVLDGSTDSALFGQGGAGSEGRPTDADLVRARLAVGQSELAIGQPTRIGPADSWFVSVARLVVPRPGETPLVAVADLSLTELQRLYGRLDLGPNGAIGLLRSDGVILVRHPYVPDKVGRTITGGTLMRAAAEPPPAPSTGPPRRSTACGATAASSASPARRSSSPPASRRTRPSRPGARACSRTPRWCSASAPSSSASASG